MLNSGGHGFDKTMQGSRLQIELLQDRSRRPRPAKFEVGIPVPHAVDDFSLMKWQWTRQFRVVIETDFMNPSPAEFEEVLDDEAEWPDARATANFLLDFPRERFRARFVKLHPPPRQNPERIAGGAMNEEVVVATDQRSGPQLEPRVSFVHDDHGACIIRHRAVLQMGRAKAAIFRELTSLRYPETMRWSEMHVSDAIWKAALSWPVVVSGAGCMRFVNPIPLVRDIECSKAFYRDIMGLEILSDFGSFVLFESGFAIHEGKSLEQTVWKTSTETLEPYGRRNILLYFEHDDIDTAFEKSQGMSSSSIPSNGSIGGSASFASTIRTAMP